MRMRARNRMPILWKPNKTKPNRMAMRKRKMPHTPPTTTQSAKNSNRMEQRNNGTPTIPQKHILTQKTYN